MIKGIIPKPYQECILSLSGSSPISLSDINPISQAEMFQILRSSDVQVFQTQLQAAIVAWKFGPQ